MQDTQHVVLHVLTQIDIDRQVDRHSEWEHRATILFGSLLGERIWGHQWVQATVLCSVTKERQLDEGRQITSNNNQRITNNQISSTCSLAWIVLFGVVGGGQIRGQPQGVHPHAESSSFGGR